MAIFILITYHGKDTIIIVVNFFIIIEDIMFSTSIDVELLDISFVESIFGQTLYKMFDYLS